MPKFESLINAWLKKINHLPGNTLNWCSIILAQCVFVPTLLALLTNITDYTPPIDIVLLVQSLCLLSFLRSVVIKDNVAVVLHSLGWFAQVVLFSLIMFK